MAEHTPGPWRVSNGYIASERDGYVPLRSPFRTDAFTQGPMRSSHSEGVLAANAALVAAAPEMFTELSNAAEALCGALCGEREHTEHCRRRRAVLAKARGEAPE